MTTDWLSAIGMLLAGIVIGFVFVYAFVRRDRKETKEDLELRDLETKRDSLVQQLREIEDGAPAAAAERARLEREAADVLRAIDARAAAGALSRRLAAEAAAATPVVPAINPTVKGFLWGAGSVAVLALLGYFVVSSAKPKEAAAPQTPPQPQATPQSDPAVRQLETAVQKNPDDLNLRIDLAKAYLDRENLMGVFEQTRFVLEKSPSEPRAQTYQAIVRVAMGQADVARQLLLSATKIDPSLTDAWVALAWLHTAEGRNRDADAAIREAIKHHPEEEARLSQVLAQMRAHVARQPQEQASQQEQAPPREQSRAKEGETAGSTPAHAAAVHVTLQLAAGARVPRSGVIFVIARGEGDAGPPAAVKRLALGSFPMSLDLSSADSMMGQPLPQRMRIEARVDSDGDAATRDPNDPTAAQGGIAVGSRVTLTLK